MRHAPHALYNPKAGKSFSLCWAAEGGHLECVKLLIPVSDPKAADSQALCRAADNGHAECVKLLIPVSDPRADNSGALRLAVLSGHMDCVKLLLPVSDPLGRDDDGLTAQDLALRDKHPEVAAIIGRFIEDQAEAKALLAARRAEWQTAGGAQPRSQP